MARKKFPSIYKFDIKNINQQDPKGNTALIQAAKEQDSILCLKLMDTEGIDVNIKNKMGDTALKFFVIGNQKNCIQKYIQKGGDINVQMYFGFTALMLASYRGLDEIINLLLENNADLKKQDKEGFTALMHATMNGHVHIVKIFKNKIDKDFLNLKNQWGNTALMEACFFKKKDVVKELLLLGSNKDLKNLEGKTASDIAISEWVNEEISIPKKIEGKNNLIEKYIEKVKKERVEKIKILFNEKAPDDIPLIKAIKNKDTKNAIKLLKESGNIIDWDGHSAYDWAMYIRPPKKNLEKRKLIIDKINKIFGNYLK